MLPSDATIKQLHRKYARSDADFHLIYQHCQIIDAIATQIANRASLPNTDRDLLHVGCMLHDIGAYHVLEDGVFVDGVRHGVIGEQILQKEGFPESIWRFASHHTGVGLNAQDVIDQKLSIPPRDYTARTIEEKLVMYADKFHSKSKPPTEPPYFCTYEWFYNSVQQFGADKAARLDEFAAVFGKPDLEFFSQQFGQEVRR